MKKLAILLIAFAVMLISIQSQAQASPNSDPPAVKKVEKAPSMNTPAVSTSTPAVTRPNRGNEYAPKTTFRRDLHDDETIGSLIFHSFEDLLDWFFPNRGRRHNR